MEKCYKPDTTSTLNNFTIAVMKEPVFEINKSGSKSIETDVNLKLFGFNSSVKDRVKLQQKSENSRNLNHHLSTTLWCQSQKTAPLQGSSRLMSSLPGWFPDARILAGVQQFKRSTWTPNYTIVTVVLDGETVETWNTFQSKPEKIITPVHLAWTHLAP